MGRKGDGWAAGTVRETRPPDGGRGKGDGGTGRGRPVNDRTSGRRSPHRRETAAPLRSGEGGRSTGERSADRIHRFDDHGWYPAATYTSEGDIVSYVQVSRR